MIVTINPNISFWHIPKTGGKSVQAWFNENGIKHISRSLHTPPESESKKGEIFWGTVRNPYHRHASMYRYKLLKDSAITTSFYRSYPTFEKFCLNKKDKFNHIRYMNPQWDYAKYFDIILRFENIDEDFKQIQELYDCWNPLPKTNVSLHSDIDTTYTQEMKDAVYQRYKIDFDKLGYDR